MSSNPSDSPTPLAEITQGPSKFEEFLDRNQKLLLVLVILIALGAAAFVVYRGIEQGRQETAGAALINAQDLEDLKSVVEDHSGTQAAKSATVLLAEAQWSQDLKEDSIATLEAFLADEAEHPAAPTAKASLAAKWMIQGKSAEAVTLFEELVDDPQARHLAPYALICIGDIARSAGDNSRAEDAYSRAVAEYDASDYAGIANKRLRDLKAQPPVEIDPPAPEPDIPPTLQRPEETGSEDVPEASLIDALEGDVTGTLPGTQPTEGEDSDQDTANPSSGSNSEAAEKNAPEE